jgi:hypothetical protein
VTRSGGTCGYRFEKPLLHLHSFETDLSKRIETFPD